MSETHSVPGERPVFDVVAAVIVDADRTLCTRRGTGPLAGLWEFPGGKIEPGEAPEQALTREIAEELGCRIRVEEPITTTTHAYDFAVITLASYRCRLVAEPPRLTEHTAARWLAAGDLTELDWAPADLPTVRALQQATR
ncbi:(deoxy)nucleoside triphosphate pyrophosphohydrolase [Granulicoccus phenolivorans]|uniref:(deoxy)nucleoside triphosphate pyrophosphohydrolase n=1 Tax=Granulicoccus phenolivorans TaxID=266854 RepID=UPI0003FF7070|nr:(deoxy)nucleoside triphosphate pyrophosphohydrolase [Granulicoccus phenolivorans]